jgi:predicted GH43/DUF377 family glycosyl hydrolase
MVVMERTAVRIGPDPARVVAKPFIPGHSSFGGPTMRVDRIIERLRALEDPEVSMAIDDGRRRAKRRHRDIESTWIANGRLACDLSKDSCNDLDRERLLLLGMAFTLEYAFEAAALCNPSMVALGALTPDGDQPIVMSARAIGEGHISSITFRGGLVSPDGNLRFDRPSPWADNGERRVGPFDRETFRLRLSELGVQNHLSERVLNDLAQSFKLSDLEDALYRRADSDDMAAIRFETERAMHWLATSNYEVSFGEIPLGERVLSPAGPAESRGMEDARFVRFSEEDGSTSYYATYSAFDGFEVLPQLIETVDFSTFKISTLSGICARGKGMALFPRRIGGDYVALARTDNESTYVLRSDRVLRWDVAELALTPTEPWEVVQAGNCGSPMETADGWLVLMHGVGPMRRYVLSAVLLDLDEPTKVIGRLREPLLEPEAWERDGYVPNVVYSCGGLIHRDMLVVPYGISDTRISVAAAPVSHVLAAMD